MRFHNAHIPLGSATAQILSSGFARAAPAFMGKAPVGAALRALNDAGLTMKDVDLVTTKTVNRTGRPSMRQTPRQLKQGEHRDR